MSKVYIYFPTHLLVLLGEGDLCWGVVLALRECGSVAENVGWCYNTTTTTTLVALM